MKAPQFKRIDAFGRDLGLPPRMVARAKDAALQGELTGPEVIVDDHLQQVYVRDDADAAKIFSTVRPSKRPASERVEPGFAADDESAAPATSGATTHVSPSLDLPAVTAGMSEPAISHAEPPDFGRSKHSGDLADLDEICLRTVAGDMVCGVPQKVKPTR